MDNATEPVDPVTAANAAVCDAQQIVTDLIAKRAEIVAKELQLKDQRKTHAFRAHGQRDPRSQKVLTDLHRQIVEISSELGAVDEALDESRTRLAAAQQAAGREVVKQRAREALGHGEAMQAAAAGCDAALRQFLQAYDALDRACAAACGITQRPSRQTVRVAAKRALIATLTSHRLAFDTELLPPQERHTFAEIALAWQSSIEAWAAQRLAEPDTKDNGEEIAA